MNELNYIAEWAFKENLEGGNPFKENFICESRRAERDSSKKEAEGESIDKLHRAGVVGWKKQKQRRFSIGNLFPSEIHFLIDEPLSSPLFLVEAVMTGNFRM